MARPHFGSNFTVSASVCYFGMKVPSLQVIVKIDIVSLNARGHSMAAMNQPPSKRFVSFPVILALMFFGASVGVCVMALRITGKPQVFRSLGQIVAKINVGEPGLGDAPLGDYAPLVEALESNEIKNRAIERVRALHPDLTVSEISVKALRVKGSTIVNILATGSEPKYTQIFLNALLDEFMNFRRTIREKAGKENNDVAVQERATTASEHTEDWKLPILLGGSGGAGAGLILGLLIGMLTSFRRSAAKAS